MLESVSRISFVIPGFLESFHKHPIHTTNAVKSYLHKNQTFERKSDSQGMIMSLLSQYPTKYYIYYSMGSFVLRKKLKKKQPVVKQNCENLKRKADTKMYSNIFVPIHSLSLLDTAKNFSAPQRLLYYEEISNAICQGKFKLFYVKFYIKYCVTVQSFTYSAVVLFQCLRSLNFVNEQ